MKPIDLLAYNDGSRDASDVIQSLLDKGGEVSIGDGVFLIGKPLIIHDNTHLHLSPRTVLRVADGANCSLLDNDGLYSRTTNRNITIA